MLDYLLILATLLQVGFSFSAHKRVEECLKLIKQQQNLIECLQKLDMVYHDFVEEISEGEIHEDVLHHMRNLKVRLDNLFGNDRNFALLKEGIEKP